MHNSITFVAVLMMVVSCGEIEQDFVPPQYTLTAQERTLIPYKMEDVLVFENGAGERKSYVISHYEESLNAYNDYIFGTLQYYYTDIDIIISDPQISRRVGYLWARKEDRGLDLYASWYPYTGHDTSFKILYPSDGQMINDVEIRGKLYRQVLLFETSEETADPDFRNIQKIYYSKTAGFFKLVSVTGEVWEKVD